MKLERVTGEESESYVFWCPGCDEYHQFYTKYNGQSKWQFNGDMDRPTFTPSLLMLRRRGDYPGCGPRCHLIMTDGMIHFCGDCEHSLVGQTVEIPDDPYD